VSFLSLEDQVCACARTHCTRIQALYKEHYTNAFEVQVGLHELLGHGSGRLLQRIDANTFNFDRAKLCDLNGVPIVNGGFYEVGETFGSVFGHLQSAYEECRAEAVGYMLCCYDQVMK
jgi:dipeptidyl-peptidase-3